MPFESSSLIAYVLLFGSGTDLIKSYRHSSCCCFLLGRPFQKA